MHQPQSETSPILVRDLSPQQLAGIRSQLVKMLRARGSDAEDAEDLAQEALSKGLKSKVIRDPQAWLRRAAMLAAVTLARRRYWRDRRMGRQVSFDESRLTADTTAAQSEGRDAAVQVAIERLPDLLRRIVEKWMVGQTLAEIGVSLEIHQRTIGRRLETAFRMLRRLLADWQPA